MLKINDLKVTANDKIILNNFNLIINDGEIHAIMGQNGVGKSTLSRVIMGDANYKVINGEIIFNGDNLNVLSTDERAIKLLTPKFIILDELDSGLDIDSLRIVGENIKKYKDEYPNTSIMIITHHPKILEYLNPDFVHIMSNGKIVNTGDYSLAFDIEKNGYNNYLNNEYAITDEENYE